MSNDRQQRAARAEQMRKEREKADKKQRNLITIAIVVIVVALVAAGGWAIAKTSADNAVATDVTTPKGATKDFGIDYTPADAGASAADTQGKDPVTVVLYEDFQCPICKQFEAAYGAALDGLVKTGDIQLEYRLLNFLDDNGGSTNGYSGRAGSAALCVYDAQGGAAYKKVHDALYAAQPEEQTAGPEAPELIETIKAAGIKTDAALEKCITKEKFKPWIKEGVKDSRDKKVSGTPTIMVDGKAVEGQGGGVPTFEQIQAAVTAAKKA